MKTITLLCLGSLLLCPVFAQIPSSATVTKSEPPAAPAMPSITVPTTAAELASGYAAAIPQMSLKSLTIFLRSEGKTVAIKGIRSTRALGGVLLIIFSAGDMMAVNAEHIVMITDGARTPVPLTAPSSAPAKE